MKLVCFIAIELFFAAEFIYENSSLLCVSQIQLFYNNFKYIFNKNSHEEKIYHYNSNRHYLCNHEMWKDANIVPNLTKPTKSYQT